GGLARVDWALSDNPQLVIVELGANDALRGLSVEDTRDNLNSILLRIKQGGAQIVLAGMKAPRNMGEDYVGKFDL
ncbi:MAG: arylesterase, partial [Gammaproteobacteria bacterium]|nr:arylesterase [Gammaproteobacteria bacterium]